MDSIIHQVNPNENQAELTSLTGGNETRKLIGRSSRGGGSFLRSLLCCFSRPDTITDYRETPEPYDIQPQPGDDSTQFVDHSDSEVPTIPIVRPTLESNYQKPLLPSTSNDEKVCCVIDLDETLVHSSFRPIPNADFQVPVEIDGNVHKVFVLERPYLNEFLTRMGELFECILFTASLAKYADEVADKIDPNSVFAHRLFRESCVFDRGNYVKDLSRLGRHLDRTIIIDNSPASYLFQPQNAIPCLSWFDDKNDTILQDMIPELEQIAQSSREDFYSCVDHAQARIRVYNQQHHPTN